MKTVLDKTSHLCVRTETSLHHALFNALLWPNTHTHRHVYTEFLRGKCQEMRSRSGGKEVEF